MIELKYSNKIDEIFLKIMKTQGMGQIFDKAYYRRISQHSVLLFSIPIIRQGIQHR